MKVIDKNKLNLKEKRLLLNELNIVRDIYHKNIAQCMDLINTKQIVFIIMERIEGGELFDFLKTKKYFTGND